MSHNAYNRQWLEAQTSLDDILQSDTKPAIDDELFESKPFLDRGTAFYNVATMYIRYSIIFRKLEECYDQIVHPQKRRVLKQVLDGVMGRLLELKAEMVNLEHSDYHYMDDMLTDMKLTPGDIELPIPRYFIREKTNEEITATDTVRKCLGIGPTDEFGVIEKKEEEMSLEKAIQLIQVHERARQGRLRARFMREIRRQEQRQKAVFAKGKPSLDTSKAALLIQKIWRGYFQRKLTKKLREEEFLFLGMVPPPVQPDESTPKALAKSTEAARHIIQEQHEEDYQNALVNIREKLMLTEGPDMKENMQDQIRQWFLEVRDAAGKFPDYPDEQQGGSGALFKIKDPAELEKELKLRQEEDARSKKDKKKGDKTRNETSKDKKRSNSRKGKSKKDDESDSDGFRLQQSQFVQQMIKGTDQYTAYWKNRDEALNVGQKHDVELIKEEKRVEVEDEVRKQVDDLMREELKNLKLALDRDRKRKGKAGKKRKKGKKAGGKKGKKGKKKKDKDLTEHRDLLSLVEELVYENILLRPQNIHLSDYIGEYCYLGTTLRQANIEPMPSLADVRRVVTEYAILPLGSKEVHMRAPLIKSILLAGPRGCGKKMLVHAICTEAGAQLIDLTATNIAGKYLGKAGLNMLMHLVLKIARLIQPTVIHIGDAEKMFVRKVTRTDTSEPKRLKRDIPKLLKKLTPEDRILVVGTTRAPFDCGVKLLTNVYQKLILIPRPDYASRHLMWRHLIEKNQGIVTSQLDVSTLAKTFDGYTPGQINKAVVSVLNERRKGQLQKRPLMAADFLPFMAKMDPIYKEEEEAFKNWWAKTPLGRRRAKLLSGEEDEDAQSVKGKKGKGKGRLARKR